MVSFRFYPLFLIILFFSCSDSTGPEFSSSIHGKVVDVNGNPIAEAVIELSFNLKSIEQSNREFMPKSANRMSVTSIRFAIAEKDDVKLWITKYNSTDTIKTLINEELNAGMYSVIWDATNSDGRIVVNDFYSYHLETSKNLSSKNLLISNDYNKFTTIDNLDYYSKTDKNGFFEIEQSMLALNHDVTFDLTDEVGNSLGSYGFSRYLDIWALHNDYVPSFIGSVFIDPANGADLKFVMQQKTD